MTVVVITEDAVYCDGAGFRNGVLVDKELLKAQVSSVGEYQLIAAGAGATSLILDFFNVVKTRLPDIHSYQRFTPTKLPRDFLDEVHAIRVGREGEAEFYLTICDPTHCRGTLKSCATYEFGIGKSPIPMTLPFVGGHDTTGNIIIGALDAGASVEDAIKIGLKRTGIAGDNLQVTKVMF